MNDESEVKQPSHNDLGWLNQSKKVVSTGVSYHVPQSVDIVLCTASITITLPLAGRGREIYVNKNYAGGTVTIARTGTDVIAGGTSYSLTADYTTAHLKAIPGGWILL